MLQPPSPGSFVWFSLSCSRGGAGSTAAAVTLDTVADESRIKMPDGVTRFPARLCSRDGKIGYYERLEYDFLLAYFCALLPTFLILSCLIPVCFILFLRLCSSSHLLLSASAYFIVRVLSCRVICILPHIGIPLFLFV